MDSCVIMCDSFIVASGLVEYSQTLKEYDEINDKEICRRVMLIDLSEWAKNMKVFVSHANVHQEK